jgi:adenylyltransferase/sulfurtransferase
MISSDILTDNDKARYDRQIRLWGEAAQRRLKAASIFVAGAGGLGCPVSTYLAVAGVGQLTICDGDNLELSNLNRQTLHPDGRLGEAKAISAGLSLQALNPAIKIVTYAERLDAGNIHRIVGRPDIVVGCFDDFAAKYLLNDYCLQHHIPLIHGGVWGMVGQVAFLHPPETACLKCLFPEPLPDETVPALGVTTGLVGCIQATEALKFLAGLGTSLAGRLLTFAAEEMLFFTSVIERRSSCEACGLLKAPALLD